MSSHYRHIPLTQRSEGVPRVRGVRTGRAVRIIMWSTFLVLSVVFLNVLGLFMWVAALAGYVSYRRAHRPPTASELAQLPYDEL